jgi:hypothetical protein
MKNKLQVIDFNVVSAYMGRFLTAIVAVAVIGITVSALLSRSRGAERGVLVVAALPAGPLEAARTARATRATRGFHDSLRLLLARESNRPVAVRESGPAGDAGAGCGLFLMAMEEYLAQREEEGLVALYAVDRSAHGRDRAVLIARPSGAPSPEFAGIGADQCIFSGPSSLNGCWVQLELLEAEGFRAGEGTQSLHYPKAGGAARVVFSVLFEGYTLGACRRSDIENLIAEGSIAEGEVAVVRSSPAVPEMVFACREPDAAYFGRILAGFALRLANPGDDPEEQVAAALLGSGGMRSVRPIAGEEITRAAALFGRMKGENREGAFQPY